MNIEKSLADALTKMFPNGGETYTREEIQRIFEAEGVDVSELGSLLSRCIKDGLITDCGNDNYTR